MGAKGIITSTAGLAILLQRGIGDTIRVSLTPDPGGDRTEEVQVAQQVLQSMGLRSFLPQVSACPGCGRTTSTFFQEMARDIQSYLVAQMPRWREAHPGVEELRVAVMGCVVNGPGESSTPTSHQPARHLRGAGGAGFRGRREDRDAGGDDSCRASSRSWTIRPRRYPRPAASRRPRQSD